MSSTKTLTRTAPAVATTVVTTAEDGKVHTATTTLPGSTFVEAVTAAAGSGGKATDSAGSSSGDKKSGLGTGAIVGIIVGVICGLVLLTLAVWVGIRLGKKGAANGSSQMNLATAMPPSNGGMQTFQSAPAPMYSTTGMTGMHEPVEKDTAYHVTGHPEELAGRELRR